MTGSPTTAGCFRSPLHRATPAKPNHPPICRDLLKYRRGPFPEQALILPVPGSTGPTSTHGR